VVGSATGGSQGTGTLNATGLYVNGVHTERSLYKTADLALTASYADVTNLTFAVAASKSYGFKFCLIADADATTTGIDVAVNGPTIGTGTIIYTQKYYTTASAYTIADATAYDNNTASTGSNGTAKRIFVVEGILINGTTAGTLAARAKREAVGSATIRAGSYGEYWLLN